VRRNGPSKTQGRVSTVDDTRWASPQRERARSYCCWRLPIHLRHAISRSSRAAGAEEPADGEGCGHLVQIRLGRGSSHDERGGGSRASRAGQSDCGSSRGTGLAWCSPNPLADEHIRTDTFNRTIVDDKPWPIACLTRSSERTRAAGTEGDFLSPMRGIRPMARRSFTNEKMIAKSGC